MKGPMLQLVDATSPPNQADPLATLARAAVGGDGVAMDALLRRLLPRVRNLARYLTRGDRDVDDFAQRAMAQIARKLATFSGVGTFTAWADRVTTRETFAELQRRKTDVDLVAPASLESVPADGATIPEQYMARREMAFMLDRLSKDQRTALVLHHVLELSIPEIAVETGVAAETVRSRLRLGKARLRQLGARDLPEED